MRMPDGTHRSVDLPMASKVEDPGLPASRTVVESVPVEVVVRLERPLWLLVVIGVLGLGLMAFATYHLGGKLDALISYRATGGR